MCSTESCNNNNWQSCLEQAGRERRESKPYNGIVGILDIISSGEHEPVK